MKQFRNGIAVLAIGSIAALAPLREVNAQSDGEPRVIADEKEPPPFKIYRVSDGVFLLSLSTRHKPGDMSRWSGRIANREKITFIKLNATQVSEKDIVHLADFSGVEGIDFNTSSISEQCLGVLAKLPQLKSIEIYRTSVSGRFLESLKPLRNLRELRLRNTQFEDSNATYLRQFAALEELDLRGANLTDRGAEVLADLKKLNKLTLAETKVTTATAKVVATLPELKELWLDFTQVENEAVKSLAKLPKLEVLRLNNTPIDDEALRALAGHPSLRILSIGNNTINPKPDVPKTKITNAGIEPLLSIPTLEEVWLKGTGVTRAGWTRLFELPKFRRIYANDSGLAIMTDRVEFEFLKGRGTPLVESPDGKRGFKVVLPAEGLTPNVGRIIDLRTGKPVGPPIVPGGKKVPCHAFSPDGRYLATGAATVEPGGGWATGGVEVWEVATGKLVAKSNLGRLGPVTSVAFSEDGKKILVESGKYERDGP